MYTSTVEDNHESLIRDFAQHPVMDRVQTALYTQLTRTYERLQRDLKEENEAFRRAKRKREDFGVTLYSHQQQLSHLQQSLDESEERYNALNEKRHEDETKLSELREKFSSKQKRVNLLKASASNSQKQFTSLSDALRQVKTYNKEIKDEISITQTAANKIAGKTRNLEKEKLSQDIYIDGLYEQAKRFRTEISILEAEYKSQSSQSVEKNMIMKELLSELELISIEKKQLMLQWKSSLVALVRRDEALTVAKQQCKKVIASTRDHDVEIDSIQRDIKKAQEKCSSLVMLKERLESEISHIHSVLSDVQSKSETTSVKFDVIERSIANESEKDSIAKAEAKMLSMKLTTLNNSIDIITRERHNIEECIENAKFEKLTVSKSTESLKKIDRTILRKTHEKELELAKIQNDLSRNDVMKLNVEENKQQMKLKLNNINDILNKKHSKIELLESNIKHRSDMVTKSMQEVEKLNRKYNKMLDGVEDPEALGPLEATIKSYEKEIAQLDDEIQSTKGKWLSSQEELVKIMTNVSEIQDTNQELNARTSVLIKKQSRLNQEIHRNESEMKAIYNGINNMHSDKVRLDKLIGYHADQRYSLIRENKLVAQESAIELKELKGNLQAILDNIKQIISSKHLVLSQLVEVETNILEWKKKIQLEKEARCTIESEDAQKVKGMEREINRMRHRLECLHRDQENMIRAMENAIYKKEDIAVKYGYENKSKQRRSGMKSKAEIKRELSELTSALKTIRHETEGIIQAESAVKEDIKTIIKSSNEIEIQRNQLAQDMKEVESNVDRNMFQKRRILMRSNRMQQLVGLYVSLETSDKSFNEKATSFNFSMAIYRLKKLKKVVTEMRLRHNDLENVLLRVDELSSDIFVDLL